MKLMKTASGKQTIKMSKKEWESIGKKAGFFGTTKYYVIVYDKQHIPSIKDSYEDKAEADKALLAARNTSSAKVVTEEELKSRFPELV